MLQSVDTIFKRIIDTLQDLIIPALPSPYLKGQALSIVGILNNLIGRVEEDHRFYGRRNEDISKLLEEVVSYFRTGQKGEVPKRIEELCQKIPGELDQQYDNQAVSYKDKNRVLNGLMEEILKVLEEQKDFLSPRIWQDIQKKIHQQLRHQLNEELSRLNIFEMADLFKR